MLVTERLILKSPLGVVNAKDVVSAIADENTVRYMDSAPSEYTLEDASSFLRFLESVRDDAGCVQLGLFLKDTGEFIGMVSLENIDPAGRSGDLGYWVSERHVGKGLAGEACRGVIDHARLNVGMSSINAYVITENARSIRLLETLGFSRVRTLPKDVENKGELVDRYLYTLVLN